MGDETKRAAKRAATTPKNDFANVEFLSSSLSSPTNVLRAKLKELSELPAGVTIRRVMIVCDVLTDDGRELDVVWSAHDDEPPFIIQDSIVSLLTRVQQVMANSED